MMRKNTLANISLAPPEVTQANFGAPAPMPNIPMESPDTGEQVANFGSALMGLKKRFGASEAVKGVGGMDVLGKA